MIPSLSGKTTRGALLIGAVLLLGASGCGTSAADLCDAVCDCEGCSDAQLDDCVDELEDIEERASERGCEDEMDDWMSCVDSKLECSGDDARIDGCDDEERELTRCGDASG
ncbi:MAG: hypothetical protein WKG00_10860 [Polyangiaceae bacterium]